MQKSKVTLGALSFFLRIILSNEFGGTSSLGKGAIPSMTGSQPKPVFH